jgi:nicotinamide phosphoribosyltransferase
MQKFSLNAMLLKDFYKVGHPSQYPTGMQALYSNFTPRSDKLAQKLDGVYEGKLVAAGMQGFCKYILIDFFNENFFDKPKEEAIQEYKEIMDEALATDMDCQHIADLHDLGYLPVKIKALPEGSLVPVKVPMFTIRETNPKFAWVVNGLETILSASNWKAINTATIAWQYRKLLQNFAIKTGSPLDFVMWQGHDFAFRGQSGWQDAMTSSVGHQFSFLGTDTIPVIPYMKHYYGDKTTFVGGSVPASEHSVASANIAAIVSKLEREGFAVPEGSNIKLEAEKIFFGRYVSEIYPSGVCSYVADTYNFWDVITEVAVANKGKILARTENALGLSKVVFRPDSGDPTKIICGYKIWDSDAGIAKCPRDVRDEFYEVIKSNDKYYLIEFCYDQSYGDSIFEGYTLGKQIRKEEAEGAIQTLWNIFGGTLTSTGHKLLNSKVGLIYGDSITLKRAQQILETLDENGFASANVVFGIGSFTYQYNTRDSFGMAMKATYCEVDGEPLELFKDPVTDSGTKKSAKGLLRVEKIAGEYKLFDQQTPEQEAQGELKVIFENSQMLVDETLDTIRQRINESL